MFIYNDESGEFKQLVEEKEKDFYCIFSYTPEEDITCLDEQAPICYSSVKELMSALASKALSNDLTEYLNDGEILVIRKISAISLED